VDFERHVVAGVARVPRERLLISYAASADRAALKAAIAAFRASLSNLPSRLEAAQKGRALAEGDSTHA